MKIRYSLVLFVVSLFACAYSATAGVFDTKKVLECGHQPCYIGDLSNSSMPEPFVICAGYEKTFDGIIKSDSGEFAGSIWKFVPGETASFTKVKDFEKISLNFNIRPAIDYKEGKLYLPINNKVKILSTKTFEELDSIVTTVGIGDVKLDEKYVYILGYDWGAPSKMFRYKRSDFTKPYDSVDVPRLAKHLVLLPNEQFAFLIEGGMSKPQSYIHFFENKETMKEVKKLFIGGVGNHLTMCGDYLYATMNTTMDVKIIDWKKQELVDSLEFGITGQYDGPRESFVLNPKKSADYKDFQVYTTAYDGFVYYSEGTKIIEKSEDIQRKRQSVVYFDGIGLMVGNINTPDYKPGTNCTIYSSANSIEENKHYEATVFPNPVASEINMNLAEVEDGNCTIGIYDVKANLVVAANANIVNNTLRYDISKLNLSNGAYYIVVKTSDKLINSKFIVK